MNVVIIILVSFVSLNSLNDNSKKEIKIEPEVLEVVKEETTEPEVLEVVKTTVDIEDSNKRFFNQYLYYIIGFILLIGTFGYIYFRSKKNEPSTEFRNTTNDEDKSLENQTNLRTEQSLEPEVIDEENVTKDDDNK